MVKTGRLRRKAGRWRYHSANETSSPKTPRITTILPFGQVGKTPEVLDRSIAKQFMLLKVQVCGNRDTFQRYTLIDETNNCYCVSKFCASTCLLKSLIIVRTDIYLIINENLLLQGKHT